MLLRFNPSFPFLGRAAFRCVASRCVHCCGPISSPFPLAPSPQSPMLHQLYLRPSAVAKAMADKSAVAKTLPPSLKLWRTRWRTSLREPIRRSLGEDGSAANHSSPFPLLLLWQFPQGLSGCIRVHSRAFAVPSLSASSSPTHRGCLFRCIGVDQRVSAAPFLSASSSSPPTARGNPCHDLP